MSISNIDRDVELIFLLLRFVIQPSPKLLIRKMPDCPREYGRAINGKSGQITIIPLGSRFDDRFIEDEQRTISEASNYKIDIRLNNYWGQIGTQAIVGTIAKALLTYQLGDRPNTIKEVKFLGELDKENLWVWEVIFSLNHNYIEPIIIPEFVDPVLSQPFDPTKPITLTTGLFYSPIGKVSEEESILFAEFVAPATEDDAIADGQQEE